MTTRRALVSVYDKTGVVEFCRSLVDLGFLLISTGGTAAALRETGVAVTHVSELTGFPEVLGGRVKTLHPVLHAGILADRSNRAHMGELEDLGIAPIDLVAVNLYPFRQTVSAKDVALETALENIDIGGPAMIRAAAKNFRSVVVVVDPGMYPRVLEEIRQGGDVSAETRRALAAQAFRHTAQYDALISHYLGKELERFPAVLNLTLEKAATLRYGENPHQRAAFYREPFVAGPCIAAAAQLHGQELSFNNLSDANAALELVREFSEPAAVVVKHASPCGVATGCSIEEAFAGAHEADPVSIFGGIVGLNREVDAATARRLARLFLEVLVAPGYEAAALEALREKKDLRILAVDMAGGVCADSALDLKKVRGGLLVQELDVVDFAPSAARVVTVREPVQDELRDLLFAWKVVKHVRSNAVVVARRGRTLGIGGGQTSRIDAARQALGRAGELARGAVLASDGFFPFPDVVEEAARAGILAIIQPGGSVRDDRAIEAADRSGVAMIFTGMRHFKH